MTGKMYYKSIAIVDDHNLFRKGMMSLIETFGNDYKVLFEAKSGADFIQKAQEIGLPSILLLDINMPEMDGFEVVEWVNNQHTDISILIVSMVEKEETILRMLKAGVKGYLTKNVDPIELKSALQAITSGNYHYTDFITGKLIHTIQSGGLKHNVMTDLSDREMLFLKLVCSELTYQQIADKMFLSHKTIDGYRNALFEKLKVKSRTGLALFAVKNGLVTI